MHTRPRPHAQPTTTTATSLRELAVSPSHPVNCDPIGSSVGMVMGKKSHKADGGGARCRRHRHQGGAGVCPLCLRERLSRLSLSSASLPSVVARDEVAASSCSDSEAASSTEGSTGASSASGSDSPRLHFHHEMRRSARPSLLMRHERVVAVDGDDVVGVVRRRRERTSFWAKLLRATTGGGGRKEDRCSLQAHSKKLDAETSTASKWILSDRVHACRIAD